MSDFVTHLRVIICNHLVIICVGTLPWAAQMSDFVTADGYLSAAQKEKMRFCAFGKLRREKAKNKGEKHGYLSLLPRTSALRQLLQKDDDLMRILCRTYAQVRSLTVARIWRHCRFAERPFSPLR